jgi:flagellar hook-length control protein FliK
MTNTATLIAAAASLPAPNAVPAGNSAAAAVPAAGDAVLSGSELLQLLEQDAGFAQALAAASVPVTPPVAAGAGAATVEPAAPLGRQDAGPGENDDTPCDIVTLIRLLESQPLPPAVAAVAGSPAGDDRGIGEAEQLLLIAPQTAAGTDAASVEPTAPLRRKDARSGEDADAPCDIATLIRLLESQPQPAAAGRGPGETEQPPLTAHGPARTSAALPAPVGAAASGTTADPGPLLSALDATPSPPVIDAAAVAAMSRDGSVSRLPDATPASADPAQVTLSFVQNFKTGVPTSAPVERVIHVPVRDPAWPQAVAAEIHFLTDQKIEAATLRLSPEHLGPVEVRIDVRDNNVSVSFGATHVDTQAALEQALPRLREMFAAAGLNLGQASVQQEARRGSHNGNAAPASGANATDNADGAGPGAVRAVGLVDEYV